MSVVAPWRLVRAYVATVRMREVNVRGLPLPLALARAVAHQSLQCTKNNSNYTATLREAKKLCMLGIYVLWLQFHFPVGCLVVAAAVFPALHRHKSLQ